MRADRPGRGDHPGDQPDPPARRGAERQPAHSDRPQNLDPVRSAHDPQARDRPAGPRGDDRYPPAQREQRARYREALGGQPRALEPHVLGNARANLEQRSPNQDGRARPGDKTRGVWFDDGGAWGDDLVSGVDADSQLVRDLFAERGERRMMAIKDHVETKLAARMVHDEIKNMTVVLDNIVCRGARSCETWLPRLLPRGYNLRVCEYNRRTQQHQEPRVIRGEA